jgi:Fibronectin type III domain
VTSGDFLVGITPTQQNYRFRQDLENFADFKTSASGHSGAMKKIQSAPWRILAAQINRAFKAVWKPLVQVCNLFQTSPDQFVLSSSLETSGQKLALKGRVALFGTAVLWISLCSTAWCSQSATLAWDPSPDTNNTSYVVYYGTAPGSHPNRIDVGTNTATTISGLKEGLIYYFIVTTLDTIGLESDPSNEISFITPGIILVSPGSKPNDPTHLKFPVAPSHWYEIQAAQKLGTWTTIWQTTATSNAWVQFDDPKTNGSSMRFYRVILH